MGARVAWGFHLGSSTQIVLPWSVRFYFLSLDFWVCYFEKIIMKIIYKKKKTYKTHYSFAYVFRLFLSFQKATHFFSFSFHVLHVLYLISCSSTHPDADLEELLSANDFFEPSRFPLVFLNFPQEKYCCFIYFWNSSKLVMQ